MTSIVHRLETQLRTLSTDYPRISHALRGARPLVGKLLRRLKPVPRNYRSVVADYQTYISYQTEKHQSFESQNELWESGQQRYLERVFQGIDRSAKILDIASGDGVGLRYFKSFGFSDVTGVELSKEKAAMARQTGYRVEELDMHKLHTLKDAEFDIVYSSHTLEHAYEPMRVVAEWHRVLKPGGSLFLVLPYPDPPENGNDDVHGGKYELGTHLNDQGAKVQQFFRANSFAVKQVQFDSYREPEIWLTLERK